MDKYYHSEEFLKPYFSDSEAETGAETVIYDVHKLQQYYPNNRENEEVSADQPT